MDRLLLLADLVFCIILLYVIKRLATAQHRHSLPPGPSRLPILGNVREWPTSDRWLTFTSWKEKYGDIVYANVLGSDMVIVSSVEKAISMLHGSGAIYSERPWFVFAGEMLGWKNVMPFLNDGPELKAAKRLFTQTVGSKALCDKFAPMMETKTRELARRLLDDPRAESLEQHIRTHTSAIILDLTYGYTVKTKDDELVRGAEHAMSIISKVTAPGVYLVDSIPWLAKLPSWFPGTGFMQEAIPLRRVIMDFVEKPYAFVKDQLTAGVARPSFVANNLEGRSLTPQEEHNVMWTAACLFAGGSDTTISTILSFFLYMTLFPEVQARGQAEIEAVVGNNRLPEISDRSDLPFVNAIMKEVSRLGQVLPSGFPHIASKDDVFDGFFVPKGTMVIPNIWYMARDPRTYSKPDDFDPTRFMGDQPELDPSAYVFGFGRRKCPGRLLADDSMFITCATVLAIFDVSKARDAKGQPIEPIIEYEGTLFTHPCQFPCVIKPRLSQADALVRNYQGQ